jgi:D-glycero-D-manno-heptose 1,7-bisphosphate phosphatase
MNQSKDKQERTGTANPESRQSTRPVVFLDRDGTLNVELGYIREINQLSLLPGAVEAVELLNSKGVAAVVVTNQSGVARGLYPEAHVQKVNRHLEDLLAAGGARLDAVYYCPHHREGTVAEYAVVCDCRKPAVGLLQRAFKEMIGLDRSRAYMIGDQSTDIDLARNAGIKAVMVATGLGQAVLRGEFQWKVEPDFVAETVLDAVRWILSDLESL